MARSYRFDDAWLTAAVYALAGALIVASSLDAAPKKTQPPLRFEENTGQTDPNILFLTRGARQRVFLTRQAAVLQVLSDTQDAVVRLEPLGAAEGVTVTGEGEREAKSRYIGAHGSHKARQFQGVRYESLYSGIDWVFYGTADGRLEHDFVVAPGANPAAIALRISGADALNLSHDGALELATSAGNLELLRPVAYQMISGRRTKVPAAFELAESGVVSFTLGAYDSAHELVIDPVLDYATYLGGAGADTASAIVVDEDGSAFVVGATRSLDFPVSPGAPQEDFAGGQCGGSLVTQPCFDVFAAKLSADGTDILWATYFGGTGADLATDAASDGLGGLLIAGTTFSDDLPTTPGSAQPEKNDMADAFLLRLDDDGSLLHAGYLGGGDAEEAAGIAGGPNGEAYLIGHTKSTDFPATAGAFATENPSDAERSAVFVAKVSADGGTLEYATYLGGALEERAGGITVNADGEAFVTGSTGSGDFPMAGDSQIQPERNGVEADAFVARLSADGSSLLYSTYLGGTDSEHGLRVRVLADDSAIVAGSTASEDFPATAGSLLPVWKRSAGFAAKVAADGATLDYATYLVGTAASLAVDAEGSAFVTGVSGSQSPFGQSGIPGCAGSLLRKISPDGSQLLYSGFSPGLGAIALGAGGAVYSAGSDGTGVLEVTEGGAGSSGQTDVYVAKLAMETEEGISLTCVEHGASFFPGGAAPGQIISLFGSGLGPKSPAGLVVENGFVTTEVEGVRVLFDGTPAPLLFVWWNQLNAVVPYNVAGKESVTIVVERDGETSAEFEMPVSDSHPGLFTRDSTGAGLGALLNQDGSINSPENPAPAGSIVSFYGTGEGPTEPAGIDGLVASETGENLPKPTADVTVEIGDAQAEVLYVGAAPGYVSGVLQINARIPESTEPGQAPVRVTIGGQFNRQPVYVEVE